MSTDWNVYCRDCKSTHDFNDANHCEQEMAVLCRHATAIAGLAALMREAPNDVQLSLSSYGAIDPDWFATHAGHRLVPINEYGEVLGQCDRLITCYCGARAHCKLAYEHTGDCSAVTK